MITLRPFTIGDFDILCPWIQKEEDLFQFAGPVLFTFPVTRQQVRVYLENPYRSVYAVVKEKEEVIGMGEIFWPSGSIPRLCRILVGPAYRGQGTGEHIVRELLHISFAKPAIDRVELNVYDFNTAAIACYRKIGFCEVLLQEENTTSAKDWKAIRMSLDRDTFIK